MTPLRRIATCLFRTTLAIVLGLVLAGTRPSDARAAEAVDLEHRIKAAYLYNFTKFVEWPDDISTSADEDPFNVALVGEGRMVEALAPLQQKLVKGRPLQFLRPDGERPLPRVDLLYVDTQDPAEIQRILSAVKGQPVLTIGESPVFIRHGGLINFYRADKKIRFEINAEAARRKGFKISSQLLKLARIVDAARIVEGEAP